MKSEIEKVSERVGEWHYEIAELERKISMAYKWLLGSERYKSSLQHLKSQINRPSIRPKTNNTKIR